MKGLNMKKGMTVPGMVLCAIWLTACVSAVSPQQPMEERAMGRWDALLNGDLAGAYEYLSPGARSSVSSLQYQRSILLKPVQWKSAEYVEENCGESTCIVKILVKFSIRGALPGVRSFDDEDIVTESWVRIDGVWYYVPEQ